MKFLCFPRKSEWHLLTWKTAPFLLSHSALDNWALSSLEAELENHGSCSLIKVNPYNRWGQIVTWLLARGCSHFFMIQIFSKWQKIVFLKVEKSRSERGQRGKWGEGKRKKQQRSEEEWEARKSKSFVSVYYSHFVCLCPWKLTVGLYWFISRVSWILAGQDSPGTVPRC